MQKAQKSAAKSESERCRCFRLEHERRVVQLEFCKCIFQVIVLCAVGGIYTGKYHRRTFLISCQRSGTGLVGVGNGISYTCVFNIFDRGSKVSDITGTQYSRLFQTERSHKSAFNHLKLGARCHHFNPVACFKCAVHHSDIYDNPFVAVVKAVKNECGQRGVFVSCRRGDIINNRFQNGLHVDIHFGGYLRCILCGYADYIFDFVYTSCGIGSRQVDFIDNRHKLQIVVNGNVCIGKSLCLYTLRGIDNEHGTLTGSKRAGNLIVEIHMSGRIY